MTIEQDDWIWLLKRYADGQKLCNCQEAYRDASGQCRHGCSTNTIYAKYYVASKVRKELEDLLKSQNPPQILTEEELVEQQEQDEYEPPEWLPDNRYLGC